MKGDGKKSRVSESTLVIRCDPDDVEFTREGHIVIKDRLLSADLKRSIRASSVSPGRSRTGAKTRMPPGDPPPIKNQHCRAARRVSVSPGPSRAASKKRMPPGDPPPIKNQHCLVDLGTARGKKRSTRGGKKRMPLPPKEPPKNKIC